MHFKTQYEKFPFEAYAIIWSGLGLAGQNNILLSGRALIAGLPDSSSIGLTFWASKKMDKLDKASWHIFVSLLRGSIFFDQAFGPRNSKPGQFSEGKARGLIESQSERCFWDRIEPRISTKREVLARRKSFLFLFWDFIYFQCNLADT